jgi:hypothetical protein
MSNLLLTLINALCDNLIMNLHAWPASHVIIISRLDNVMYIIIAVLLDNNIYVLLALHCLCKLQRKAMQCLPSKSVIIYYHIHDNEPQADR